MTAKIKKLSLIESIGQSLNPFSELDLGPYVGSNTLKKEFAQTDEEAFERDKQAIRGDFQHALEVFDVEKKRA